MELDIFTRNFELIQETQQEIFDSFAEFKNWNISKVSVVLARAGVDYSVNIDILGKKLITATSHASELYEAYYKAYDRLPLWEGTL